MSIQNRDYVFLTDCGDLGEAQVLKSFLESQGFNPRVRDLHMRTVASHLGSALGKLTLEIPSDEFFQASKALEDHVVPVQEVTTNPEDTRLHWSQNLAKKALWNAILGAVLVPLLPNFYSMILGFRVLRTERPVSKKSMTRLFWAIVFNSIAFIVWFVYLPGFLREFMNALIP